MAMLTDTQRGIFTKLLDANWKLSELYKIDKPVDYKPIIEAETEVHNLTEQLRNDMGKGAFDNFMNAGREMFSSSKTI
jgi:hypothetical protein